MILKELNNIYLNNISYLKNNIVIRIILYFSFACLFFYFMQSYSPLGIDWICVSPKPNTKLKITEGDELKFIYPQPNFKPEPFEKLSFKHFYIQPMDSEKLDSNTNRSIKFCMKNANWKISLQSHKILGIQ